MKIRTLLKSLKLNSSTRKAVPLSEEQRIFHSLGTCPICSQEVEFVAHKSWLRDFFVCSNCGSIPRERALMAVINDNFPEWRNRVIHETSPSNRGASAVLQQQCKEYIASQFLPGTETGSVINNIRCENLEALTFPDESIDLHVSQDVLEHVFHPSKAFSEIARTLRPGGMHIFTVPIVNKYLPSRLRATVENGTVLHLLPEQYHGNPVGDGKALVTVDWGFDICRHIYEASGLYTQIIYIDDLSRGIRAEYIEVLVSFKPDLATQIQTIP